MVMDIFQTQVYRLNIIFLSIIGLWPYHKYKSWQLFQQVICHISVFTVMISQVIKLFEIWGDMDIMIECVTPIGVHLIACIKALNASINRKQMTKLLETMRRDWSSLRSEKETEILLKYTEEGRNVCVLYAGESNPVARRKLVHYPSNHETVYSCTIAYLLIPLLPKFLDVIVPLNESRANAIYLYPTQYYVDPEEYYIWICVHTYSASLITITTIIATDSMFACYVMHVRGILAVIGYKLKNLKSKRPDTDVRAYISCKDDDYRCYQEIVFYIDQHHKATEVTKIIESSYSISYLSVIGVCMLLMSMSMVQIVIKFGQVGEMIRLFEFNLAQCTHLLFNSWPCQKLTDESINFRDSLYASEWYSLSEPNKHLLQFAMLRTLKPQKITAGKLYIMSMENFGWVLKTSISYFTVFASIR